MKIAIDISPIIYGTGVSVYTQSLVGALLAQDKKNEYLLFGGSLRRKKELKKLAQSYEQESNYGDRVRIKIWPLPPILADFLWNRLHFFPIENLIGSVDVCHCSDWTQPPAKQANLVTTIHDLSFLRWPESAHPKVLAVQKRRLSWAKKEAAALIAVSQATKEEAVKLLGIPVEKIRVIYEAVSQDVKEFAQSNQDSVGKGELKKRWRITRPYLFAYGSQSPRKNIERLIQAFEMINQETNCQLVIAGEYRATQKLSDKIILTGFLPRQQMLALFAGSQVFVYPSLYEGFGFPILEAFTLKIPVVTSNTSSMPEVAGQAAVLVDPLRTEAIAVGIKKALRKRKELIAKGDQQVKKFSWQKAAQQTLKVYQEVI